MPRHSANLPTIDLLGLVTSSRSLSNNTIAGYQSHVRAWLAYAGDDPRTWHGQVAQAFYDKLLKDGTEVLSANTMLWGVRWAIERLRKLRSDLLPGNVNPIDAVERTRSPKKHTRHPLAADAAKRFLAACHGSSIVAKRDHAAVLLGFATGLRRAGLASIDLDRVAGFGDHVRMTVTLKGGEVYGVPVSGHLWQMIEPYREMLGDRGPLFRSIRPPGPSASTFVVGTRPISPQGLYQILQRRALTARIPNFHPHLLRHTLVSWCLDAGIDPLLISVVTGHAVSAAGASARSLEHYTDRSMPSLGSKAAAAVWNLLVEKLEL